jgi:putative protease
MDLCTIHFLNKILDAGVEVLKIEGRARSAEYVKTVTSCYAEAIQAWKDGNYSPDRIREWTERLSTVFNRGFWDGYYLGQRLGEWTHQYGSIATRQKKYIGKVVNYYPKVKAAEILVEAGEIQCGDELLIIGPTTGVYEIPVREIRLDINNRTKAVRGDYCSIPVGMTVRRNDKVYTWVEAARESGQSRG